ncbi:hypothetical protein SPHINGO8BC_51345 [Sphingobacterium multivorum]|uniref:Uncharacterized protein n=1 Tax=Sphingobacterium multivorum TaxID=28454 RepID=A0A654CXG3_SPHMU|nr:hypothetical protein SPHINGO8BC_51345 [Sphingobacterium multivorum]
MIISFEEAFKSKTAEKQKDIASNFPAVFFINGPDQKLLITN